ncbi:hypothetical protein ACFFRR_001995 [Megaselia abdita]
MASLLKLNRIALRSFSSQVEAAATCPHIQPKKTQSQNVKPYSKIPVISKFSLIRRFLPGGEFHKKQMVDVMKTLQKQNGDIYVFSGAGGKRDVVFTFNPNDYATVFRNEGPWPFRDGLDTIVYHRKVRNADFYGSNGGLMSEQHELWGRVRSAVNPVMMNPKAVKIYIPTIDKVTKDFISVIRDKRDSNTFEVGDKFLDDINNWALESIALIALNTRLGCLGANKHPDADTLINGMHTFFNLSYELDFLPSMWKYVATPKFNKLMKVLDEVSDVSRKYVELARENMKSNPAKNDDEMSVLEKLIKVDKKTAVVMAMDMLFAGIDTTSTALTACLLSLAKNQDKQSKLREELMTITEPLTPESLNSVPYLRACIKESLRFYPVTTSNGRVLPTDIVVSGYYIPKGTMVVMAMQPLLGDEKYFKDADKFVPERWIKGSPLYKGNNDPFVYLPFGFGSRSCIGKRFSNMELEIVILNILKNFVVEFNHSAENAFTSKVLNIPNIPLKFKFTDVKK